jgi:hypothetical protein
MRSCPAGSLSSLAKHRRNPLTLYEHIRIGLLAPDHTFIIEKAELISRFNILENLRH